MLDMVQNSAMPKMNQASGSYYVYPEYQEYLRKADIISIQIGSNDALVPCIVGLGEATNWKSEQLAGLMVSGALHRRSGRGHQLEERAACRTDGQRCPA